MSNTYPSSPIPQAGDLVEFLGNHYRVWKRDAHGNVSLSRAVGTATVRIERFRPHGGHWIVK